MDGGRFDRWRLNRRRTKMDWQAVCGSRPGVQVLELEDTSVRVRVQGNTKRGVVFLCDPPNLVEHFDEVFSCFGPDTGVACIEQPGFGFSFPKHGYDFSLAAHANALASALEALPFDECVLVAPCVATYSALRVARDRPELVDRLVLMQATEIEEERRWVLRTAEKFTRLAVGIPRAGAYLAKVPFLAQAMIAATEPDFGQRTYGSVIWNAPERSDLIRSLIEEYDRAIELGACNCMPNLIQSYFRCEVSDFAGAQQPTLILWGDSDPSHASSARDGLSAYVSDARVELIPDTGHHLELENPKDVCLRIQHFIQQ